MTLPLLAVAALAAFPLSAQVQPPSRPPADAPPTEPMPTPRGLARNLGDRRIVVDGNVEDWPAASPLLLVDTRQVSGTAMGAYRGQSDLSAQVFLVWSDADLYIAAKVRDDWHRPLGAKVYGVSEIPPADNLMLTFDPNRDTRAAGRDLGRSEDCEVWLADVPDEKNGKGKVVLWDRFRGKAKYSDGAAVAIARDDKLGITTYEARVPWTDLLPGSVKPKAELLFDLQVVVNDLDEVTDIMPQTRVGWTFGTGPRIDPGLLGTVALIGDLDGPELPMPEFPSPSLPKEDPVPGPRYWVELYDAIKATTLKPFGKDDGDPRVVLGEARYRQLQTLEGHLALFPRVDFLEFQQRIHRRMTRECAGIVATGLPYFWDHVLGDLRRRIETAVPDRGVRVLRLPQGGWLVLSKETKFAIDPAGHGVEHLFFELLDFVLLTDPLDMCKRNDQLLLRLLLTKKAMISHIAFHLPSIDMGKITVAEPGRSYDHKGLVVTVLGDRDKDGNVPMSVGYHLRWPDGTTIVHPGLFATTEQFPRDYKQIDLLILPAEHFGPIAMAHRAAAKITVLDDILQCSKRAGGEGRVTLEQALDLQASLRPNASLLLAPGEGVTVSR